MDPLILVVAVLALLIIIVLVKTAVVVPQQNAFVVERLGTYSGTLGAGFHVLTPFVDVIRYRHSLKEQTYDIPEQVCITRDNVQVGVDGVLYLKVLNPERASMESPIIVSRLSNFARRRCAARSAKSTWTRPSKNAPPSIPQW